MTYLHGYSSFEVFQFVQHEPPLNKIKLPVLLFILVRLKSMQISVITFTTQRFDTRR